MKLPSRSRPNVTAPIDPEVVPGAGAEVSIFEILATGFESTWNIIKPFVQKNDLFCTTFPTR